MAMTIQLRRITNAQRLALAVPPAAGEPIWTTDTKKLYVGDGSTAGGLPVKLDFSDLLNVPDFATLDGTGKVPASQLPSFVDDVIEAASLAGFPATGEAGKIYVALDTNKVYRWSGSAYVEISSAATADTALSLAVARTIALAGVVTGSVAFDGSANVSITTSSSTLAPKASPALTGTPTAPTATSGTNTKQLATTAFVQEAVGGILSKAVTSADVTLTDAEASNPVIVVTGALTGNRNLIIPVTAKRIYAVYNNTTGSYTLTIKTPSGTGVGVAQGKRNLVYADGTNIVDAFNDFESIALTGAPTAPTAAANTNTTQVATTAFVIGQAGTATPVVDGAAAVGTSTKFAREDHKHPTDTTRAPLASPEFTGTPAAPTATAGTNTTQLATTAFVQSALANFVIDGGTA